ncbi:YqaJ viral recombinase family protein [Arthrobacter sp. 18067]|uniref:YqaJ viral recombinase family nuclease n=1 Tax=Arthrobacter sp. 18067 TaxID=2681413 RepID=UPI00135C86BD|nr:YqaJ viral recombinase family protein [Arthrobacter sp. 18067]
MTVATPTAPNWGALPESMTAEQINRMIELFLSDQDPDTMGLITDKPGTRLGNAVLVGHFEDDSPEWHQARRAGIGGSEIASILGINSFKSRFVLWHEKYGTIQPEGIDPDFAEWGHRLEPVVRDKFADNHPEFEVLPGGSWVHVDRPWHLANPDGRLLNRATGEVDGIWEGKTSATGYGWENGSVPVKYVAQVRHYLECFGFEYAYISVLIELGKYKEFVIYRDPMTPVVSMQPGEKDVWYAPGGPAMLATAQEFVDSIHAGTPPPMDGGEDSHKLVRKFHPDIDGTTFDLDDKTGQQLLDARQAVKDAESEHNRMKSVVIEQMGKAKYASHRGVNIARRQANKAGPTLVAVNS